MKFGLEESKSLNKSAVHISREIENFIGTAGIYLDDDQKELCTQSFLVFERLSQQQEWKQVQEVEE